MACNQIYFSFFFSFPKITSTHFMLSGKTQPMNTCYISLSATTSKPTQPSQKAQATYKLSLDISPDESQISVPKGTTASYK